MVDRFLRPASPAEAVRLKKETGGLFLAGGTELNWKGAPATDTLISLESLALDFIRLEQDALVLGPTVSLQAVADSHDVAVAGLGILQDAARGIASRPIRCLATLGGNLASNKSCSDLIPALWIAGAELELMSPAGERAVAIGDYVAAPDRTALVAAVRIPRRAATTRAAIERFSRSAADLALINAALALDLEGSKVGAARLALGGVAATVVRVAEAEATLVAADLTGDLDVVSRRFVQAVVEAIHPIDDLRGTAAYKTDVAAALCRRVLAACVAEERS